MNDEALREAIRGSFDDVRMRVPASTLAARGDQFRARRRMITVTTTAVTAAAAAAVVVTVTAQASAPHTPASATAGSSSRATAASPASPAKPSRATLAAWSVTKMNNGALKITIREMRDPSGLQATLRADGARVVVTDSLASPAGCQEWKGGDYRMGGDVIRMANKTGLPSPDGLEMFLRPSDIPSGAALWIGINGDQVPGPNGFGYLTATAACMRLLRPRPGDDHGNSDYRGDFLPDSGRKSPPG